ncbi:HAMP domain-containing histidine kinase [Phycicoccus sp. HDW14]|uniref:sensor histidine kinase n=1 Tax=Phycicoccus sp. HDW14 TaxID=2714941 RepID=UPI0014080E13|nr:HAMP domain-containing sensor histidine kinase [Phycicoccus sp. HDW14]QIM20518.1 HAMP domain-containing histidine kinase [Phycicoccus sp. HDW14]
MTRRIAWLVAATTSAVVVAFVLPLCFLVANLASDRATTRARDQAQSVARFTATLSDHEVLERTVNELSSQGPAVSVVEPDGSLLGGAPLLEAHTLAAVERARRDQEAFTVRRAGGLDALVPVATAEGLEVVVASVTDDELRAGVPRAWLTIGLLGLGLVGVSVAAAWNLGRRVTVPVREVAEVAHRLREGDASARAVPGGPPETAELGRALNALADRIHGLVEAERENVADLGHRLRTPVTALRLDTDLVDDPEVAERLREHVDHLQRSIDDVVREARRTVATELPAHTAPGAVVAERVDFWRPLAEDQGRDLDLHVDSTTPPVALSAEALGELLDTVLDNVFAHTPEGADIQVSVTPDGDDAVLLVEDAGPGMTLPWRGRGHSARGSTGLGLAIVHRLAESAGGGVELGRSNLGGLAVRVALPTTHTG